MSSPSTQLSALYKPGRTAEDGGWGRLRDMVKAGRRVAIEERLRWQENRAFYRGEQTVFIAPGESQLRGTLSGPINAHSTTNAYNRLRQFTDGRTALMTRERPAFEVIPEDNDSDSIDAAKQAEKFIKARWGHNGWNIKGRISELAKNGDIDGVAWLSVMWDPDAAGSRDQLIAVDMQGVPITDRQVYEAMLAEDPNGEKLWRIVRAQKPLGDVSWRVVLPGAMSVDPFAVGDPKDARWVCEARMRPRSEIEEYLGSSFKDAVSESQSILRERVTTPQYEDVTVDDGSGKSRQANEREEVVCLYFFARPCSEFPRGAHIEWCEKAPGKPWVIEEWDRPLPYKPFTPRPDPGHFLKSRGVVDDLKPIQRDYNSTLRDLREWLKRVARTPVALPFGSMASDSYFNEEGVFFYHAAMGEPHHSNVPAEPTAVLTNDLARMVAEMRDISGVSASAQGLRAPGGPEAAVGINIEIQQTENNLSEFEANLVEAIEWGVEESLSLVEKHYTVARAVTGVGVDDANQFNAFYGAMIRGARRFRVTSPLMPKSKASRMAAIGQFAPLLGDRLAPYVVDLIDGDPTRLQKDLEVEASRERSDIRELVGLVRDEKALVVYQNFEAAKQKFAEAFNLAAKQGQDPIQVLGQAGIIPPRLTRDLMTAGFDLPVVEDFYRPFMQMKTLDEFRLGDAYRKLHPMAKQLLRERAEDYKNAMNQQVQSMAQQVPQGQQSGSEPAPKGTPSPPKNQPMQGGIG